MLPKKTARKKTYVWLKILEAHMGNSLIAL